MIKGVCINISTWDWVLYLAGLIQKVQNPQPTLNQVNAWLVVVKRYERPLNIFLYILLLFQFEYMLEMKKETRKII